MEIINVSGVVRKNVPYVAFNFLDRRISFAILPRPPFTLVVSVHSFASFSSTLIFFLLLDKYHLDDWISVNQRVLLRHLTVYHRYRAKYPLSENLEVPVGFKI